MVWTILLAAAALISSLTLYVHVRIGGRRVARPVLDSALPPAAKWLSYYCWHMSTITIAGMALAFALAASGLSGREAAVGATGLAGLFGALSAAVAMKGGIPPWRFPSTSLFAAAAALGAGALLA